MKKQGVAEKLEKLPEALQEEVLDFVDFLTRKCRSRNNRRGFRFDWQGGLARLKGRLTSVQLQHKAKDWR